MCPTARQDNAQIFCSFLILLFFSYLQSLIVLAQGKFATDLYNGTRTTTLACSEAKVGINLFLTFTPLWRAVLRTSLFFIQVAVWLPHDVALKKEKYISLVKSQSQAKQVHFFHRWATGPQPAGGRPQFLPQNFWKHKYLFGKTSYNHFCPPPENIRWLRTCWAIMFKKKTAAAQKLNTERFTVDNVVSNASRSRKKRRNSESDK